MRSRSVIHEVREYIPMPGRLEEVFELFRMTTIPLFRKYGMEIEHAGLTTLGDQSFSEIIYTLRFASLAEMEAKWDAFLADPAWQSALAEKEENGPLYQSIRRRVTVSGPFDEVLNRSE